MELASTNEPWTTAVAWARPWHRALPRRPAAPQANPAPPQVFAPVFRADPALERAWKESAEELRAAQESYASLQLDVDDAWLLAMARQDLYRARRRVLGVQAALTGSEVEMPWSTG